MRYADDNADDNADENEWPKNRDPTVRIRTGIGIDAHRFAQAAAGRRLVLGGVEFDHPQGLEGHSDADVLSHAVADALLGAAGLEDIGHYFPDSDPKYKDAASLEMLRQIRTMLHQRGFRIGNIDAVVIAEEPRIAPQRARIRQSLSGALGISAADIGVRGTTTERMGFSGRGEGIAAVATCLLECGEI
ncbi:MAG: 2-C-methyl-D-erythritol 2,4-cyclodiphosphate synthase [Thermoleophilia bacterium]|nr:2-C-methyl-D-erythritol 2,4-cyclodiphosphate synthase [Thermoleophilia bacterium]